MQACLFSYTCIGVYAYVYVFLVSFCVCLSELDVSLLNVSGFSPDVFPQMTALYLVIYCYI